MCNNITEEYWQTKHNAWYKEKDMLIERLRTLNDASKTFDEGTNLLENFCKHAPQEFFKANPKKKTINTKNDRFELYL